MAAGSAPWAASLALGCIVFISGGAVMIYEFLAVRILQRFVGGTLDVWGAEISICLAGLALGYSVGGYIADRTRAWYPLGVVLIIAGVTAVFMEPLAFMVDRYLPKSGEMVQWWEPLFYAGVCTFIPLLALGTVMPQAIRLAVRSMERVGSGAGWVATISTTGSICGALLAAMTFIPWGVRESIYATSAALTLTGVAILVVTGLRAGRRVAKVGILIGAIGLSPAGAETIYENYSAYHHILVRDEGNTRKLLFDDSPQTTMDLRDPYAGGFEYTDYFHLPMVLDPTTTKVLFVGLGGGTGPKVFFRQYPNVQIDVAEIDPEVVKVANRFFDVPEDPRLRIVTTDGRTFLQRTRNTYGAIVMDAYGSGPSGAYLPYHLATVEFFRVAYEHIENGGSLVYNIMGTYGGHNDDIVRGILATLEQVFQQVYVFEAKSSYNTVFVAQKIVEGALAPNRTRDGTPWPKGPWLAHPADFDQVVKSITEGGQYTPANFARRLQQISAVQAAPRTGTVYTDNNAPVDLAPDRR
jgi:spermidine synthase